MLFVNCRHWGLRQRRPPPGSNRSRAKAGRARKQRQPDEVYPRSPGRLLCKGTKGVPSISLLVISRAIASYRVIAKICAQALTFLNPELRQKNPGLQDGTDRWSSINEYPRNSSVLFFHQFTPLRRVQGLQCFAYDLYFIYKSDAFFWGGFLS